MHMTFYVPLYHSFFCPILFRLDKIWCESTPIFDIHKLLPCLTLVHCGLKWKMEVSLITHYDVSANYINDCLLTFTSMCSTKCSVRPKVGFWLSAETETFGEKCRSFGRSFGRKLVLRKQLRLTKTKCIFRIFQVHICILALKIYMFQIFTTKEYFLRIFRF